MISMGWVPMMLLTWGTLEKMRKMQQPFRFSLTPYLYVFVLLHVCIMALVTTAPGKPQVFVQQAEDGAIVLSWKLKCKNGIIEKYMVTYFDMDDTSDDESLSTPETEQRIPKLIAGKTYEFQVSC